MTSNPNVGRAARAVVILAGVALALPPASARAQACTAPFAVGTLYEVREGINCNPGTATDPTCSMPDAKGFGVRIADATLIGSIQGPPEFSGDATIEASSILNQRDWTGPAHGKIALANGTHAAFSGQLNLALAVLGQPPTPLAPISGHWTGTKGFQAGGIFDGVFLIPFQIPGHPELGVFYLQLDASGQPTGGVVPLQPNEFSANGVPLVKLLVTFCG
jgi:hypothetical protein